MFDFGNNSIIQGYEEMGHYEVGARRYLYKTEALKDSKKSGQPLKFYFNDDIYGKFDWTKEPEPGVDIREFYRRRAQQIRDKYDYLVLIYSGGPDSGNILNTYLDNDILLDEIVNFNSYDKTQVVNGTSHNADYLLNVKPVAENIIKKYGLTRTRVTIIDEIDMTKNVFREAHKRSDYYELLFTTQFFPSIWMYRAIWVRHVKHLWDKLQSGKRVGIIYGADKPTLAVVQNKHCMSFSDMNCCDNALAQALDPEFNRHNILEMFYHTPDMPEIPIKQAHLLKNYVDSAPASSFESTKHYELFDHRPAFTCQSLVHPGNLKYQIFHNIIYPGLKLNVVTPKPGSIGTRGMDCWWVNQFDGVELDVWKRGVAKHYKNYKDQIVIKGKELSGVPFTLSRMYYLQK